MLSKVFLLQLSQNENSVCCSSTRPETKLHCIDVHPISDEYFHDTLKDFQRVLNQFETTIITPLSRTTFSFE